MAVAPHDQTASPAQLPWILVNSIVSRDLQKHLRLADGSDVAVQGFACAGTGDLVRHDSDNHVWVRGGDAALPVRPSFHRDMRVDVASGLTISVAAVELIEAAQYAAYRALSQFHYRSEKGFGRRAILLLTTHDPRFPASLGFVEVTTPFMHQRNRSSLFAAPFSEPGRGVTWEAWDLQTRNRLINVIARISRVVVHPEVRGLGMTRPLVEAAAAYCRERWQVGGMRPLFLEITADMLKFMPFVRSSGMRYIGESEGNLGRLAKDMGYLSRAGDSRAATGLSATGQATHAVLGGHGKGILRRQNRDINAMTLLRGELAPDRPMEEFMASLIDSRDVDPVAWERLLPALRFPKPTYMKGLTAKADAYVRTRTNTLGLKMDKLDLASKASPCSGPIRVADLTLSYAIDTGILGRGDTGEVRRAFGLSRQMVFRTGVSELSFQIEPGQVAYIYGASGSGKTSLLSMIAGDALGEGATVRGAVSLPGDARVGNLPTHLPSTPLVQAVGASSLEQAVFALNAAGLAEPRLYLSTFDQLSAGQKYRAALASLVCSDCNVWLLDEFASGLDDGTALAVGRNFARAARRLGVILVLATVRRSPLVNAIEPDLVVHLSQLEDPSVYADWTNWRAGAG